MYVKYRIRFFRKQLGLSQSELASLSGVSQSTISDLERGKHDTSYSNLLKIASVLGVEMKELVERVE